MSSEEGQLLALSATDIEVALIEAHWRYGSQIHLKAAEALVAALGSQGSDAATGHSLFSRLFGEYAGSLETYAAWAWSLRERTEPGSFLKEYLSYRPGVVGTLYALALDHEGDLSDLLRLPPQADIVAAAVGRQGEEHAELPPQGYHDALAAQYERLKTTAGDYFRTDRILITTFNKTKHGVPMLRLFEPEDHRAFEFVMENPRAAEEAGRPFTFAAFHVNADEVAKYLNNVQRMTEAISELAAITKVLHDVGMLYPVPSADEEEDG